MEQKIRDFINSRHIAVVGVSRSNMKFGSAAFRTLKNKGYQVYPVHPNLPTFSGARCYNEIKELPGEVDALFVSVKPEQAVKVVTEAAARNIKRIWFQRGGDFSDAAQKAEALGIECVTGKCLLMYAEPVKGIHAVHRFFVKLLGKL